MIGGHFALTRKAQGETAVAAQPAQHTVVWEEPIKQLCADVVNQEQTIGLTAFERAVSYWTLLLTD